jgi:hypothetical protein
MSAHAGGAGSATPGIHPFAALLRGFAVDFLSAHDLSAVARIMAPDFGLTIGGYALQGRDQNYLPAIAEQLDIYPGLGVTVHDIVVGESAAALRFSEHGASCRRGGLVAAWGGIALFRIQRAQLRTGWAEEDYWGRKQQFEARICAPIEQPHPNPWGTKSERSDPTADVLARKWVVDPGMLREAVEIGVLPLRPPASMLINIRETQINELFSAGNRVAFHVHCRGPYSGGFEDIDEALIGSLATLRVAGLLTLADQQIVAAHIVTDRLGLHRGLRVQSSEKSS